MSVKIKVSYREPEELKEIIKRLYPVKSVRRQEPKGKYRRAYIVPGMLGNVKVEDDS